MNIDDIINVSDLRNRMEDDISLLKELYEIFLKDAEKLLKRVEDAVVSGNTAQLIKAAHTIKGAVANFSAKKAYETALSLEDKGKAGDTSGLTELFATLDRNIDEIRIALKEIIDKADWK